MYSDLKYLSTPLPEDVKKLKYFGDFDRLLRVIDLKLQKDIPLALRKRLEYEKIMTPLWIRAYPHSEEKALEMLKDCFGDFSKEELEKLRDEDAVEWAYISGQVHYKNNFLGNLIKTRPYYAARVKDEKRLAYQQNHVKMLHDVIAKMKREGEARARFHMRETMTIRPVPGREGQRVWAHLPLPLEYAQVKNFRLLSVSHPDAIVAPPDYPQRTICFHDVAKEPFTVEFSYETHMRYVDPKPEAVLDQQPSFFTEEYAPHILFTPYLKALAKEIVGNETNPLIKARKIYDFITTKMIYSFMRAYMTMPNVPEYGASSMKGDCGVQALLFITLCRICGIPARWQAGLEVCPLDVGCHDWAQFYVAPYGWLFADPSFGGGAYRDGDMERWNFYFGNLDPYRMPANSEFQHDFYVPFKNHRYDPYDNQEGEAEFLDAYAHCDSDQEALSIELF
ncbi:MAG: transglutaminase domain-containing protein [Clostridiales bacterium]|nr:transglutaminase domain-containing protein [Clostridiales bacterium]